MSCHLYVFFERVWEEVLSVDESRERGSWLSWADKRLVMFGGGFLEKNEDINLVMGHDEEIIMALAMIRHMYHKGEISEIVYKNIRKDYLPKIKSVALREKL